MRFVPLLALAVITHSLGRIAEPWSRPISGATPATGAQRPHRARRRRPHRGRAVVQRSARLTRITDTAPPEQIIPLLNDYADAIVSSIHEQGGDVLKLIGDGILAIFKGESSGSACRAALGRRPSAQPGSARSTSGATPTAAATDIYLGLHVGEVFYGNVGSKDRLDFTVVGPAVNEVEPDRRDVPLGRSAGAAVRRFREAAGAARSRLISVGRYALRGVGRPQELYTLEAGGADGSICSHLRQ